MFEVDAVRQLGDALLGDDVDALSAEERAALVVALTRLQSVGSLVMGRQLDRLHVSGFIDARFGLRPDTWLAREASIPHGVARQLLRTGTALRTPFPETGEAVADGRLTWFHAAELVRAGNDRIRDALARKQAHLIGFAKDRTHGAWRAELLSLANELDQDGGHDPARDLTRNELTMAETLDGVLHIHGKLVGEHAQLFKQGVTATADSIFHRYRRDAETTDAVAVPPAPTLLALAVCELVRRGQAVDLNTSRPAKVEATFVIEASDPTAVSDPDGVRLQDGTTRTLLCDAHLVPIIVDKLGRPLDLGTSIPFATPEQKRAIARRDGGCVFSGCDSPPWWTDAHHVRHRRHLGPTATENMVSLCRHHHGVVHRSGWNVHLHTDGWAWFTPPTGDAFWGQRHGQRRTGPIPEPPPPEPGHTCGDHPPGPDLALGA